MNRKVASTHIDGLERLSIGQKDCLRLVGQHYSSKEIARHLHISPHTVDQRLKRATAVLSASSRFDAARMLAHAEGFAFLGTSSEDDPIYQSLVYQRSDIDRPSENREEGASSDSQVQSEDVAGAMLHEVQARYFSTPNPNSQPKSLWSVLFAGKLENDLTVGARLLVMAVILFLGLLGFAILVSVLEGLSRLI